jgi:hypothetical protein
MREVELLSVDAMLILASGMALLAFIAIGASARAVATDGYHRIPVDSVQLPVAAKPGLWERYSDRRAVRRTEKDLSIQFW